MTKSDSAMRARFGVHEAKTQLSKLLQRVSAGESIDIERRGVLVATLVPPTPVQRREFGTEAGRFVVPEDFNDPLPDDLLDLFES